MTTSGTDTWTQNRNQLIYRAGRQVGAWGSAEVPSQVEVEEWATALNAIVKEWQARGIHLWSEVEGILFPVPGQILYSIGTGTADRISNAAYTTQTGLSADAATGATSISVSSITGFANGNSVGVYLDSGSYFWATVSGVPSGTTVVLASGLPGPASTANPVFCYSAALGRPLRVLAVRRYQSSNQLDTPINLIARLDYRDLPNKTNEAMINQVFYDPQLVKGKMWVWQAPVDASFLVKFTGMRQLEDFNNQVNTPDFPQEWMNTLTWNLAKEMGPEYGCPEPRYSRIVTRATETLDTTSGWDREPESIFCGVDFDQSAR